MINIAMNTTGAVDRNTLSGINNAYTQGAVNAQTIESLNRRQGRGNTTVPIQAGSPAAAPRTVSPDSQPPTRIPTPAPQTPNVPAPVQKQIPPLAKPVQKGQKTALSSGKPLTAIHARFGWNTVNPACDVDVSAFLLNGEGKVPGDSWFVFYGQTDSPDGSTVFRTDDSTDREVISIDFGKLSPDVKKIVFVLTINDAFEKKLNFSMMKDAYIRIMDTDDRTELTSFQMTEYYSNVISMMIGEVYLHNGAWKFNAIGNGVARDLAGLCALYGVEVTN